jgi:ketosteroid isomerase-like protein
MGGLIFWSGLPRTYRGKAELREWFNQVRGPWDSFHVEVEEITEAADDRVFFALLLTGRGKGSGMEAPELRVWSVSWFADGKATKSRVFRERADTPEVAGLRE